MSRSKLIIAASLLATIPAAAAAIEISSQTSSNGNTPNSDSITNASPINKSTQPADSQTANPADNQASVTVNGQTYSVSGNGSLNKTIKSDDGTTHLNISVKSSESGNQSQSSSSLNVESNSSSEVSL